MNPAIIEAAAKAYVGGEIAWIELGPLRQQVFLKRISTALSAAAPLIIAGEREACAKVAEEEIIMWDDEDGFPTGSFRQRTADEIAAAIRSRASITKEP